MSKPCRFFLQGFCRNGNNCQFAHQEVVTERDGNMGRTFVNTDKYEYRRKTDVRQRYVKGVISASIVGFLSYILNII